VLWKADERADMTISTQMTDVEKGLRNPSGDCDGAIPNRVDGFRRVLILRGSPARGSFGMLTYSMFVTLFLAYIGFAGPWTAIFRNGRRANVVTHRT
jgi:hypothetical protein